MRIVIAVMCCCVGLACSQGPAPPDRFEAIRQLVCDGKYEQALPQLKAYSGKHESRAALFMGKAHLGLGDYPAARKAFEAGVRKFPDTLEAHKCRYKLALLSYLEGDNETAKNAFEKLAADKDGPLAPEAAAFAKFIR